MRQSANHAHAERLRALIRNVPGHDHVDVRTRGQDLIIEVMHADDREPIARATRLDGHRFGLSFRSHTGRWEPMPISGDLEEIAQAMTEELGAYIDPGNL
jgi:hypothetical protein